MGKPVEYFLGMVHVKQVNAQNITESLTVPTKVINLKKLHGLGFDGASIMAVGVVYN